METIIFKLLSGPECEIKRFTSEHPGILFSQFIQNGQKQKINLAKRFTQVLSDIIVRIGTDEEITKHKVADLLQQDRNYICFRCGLFTHQYYNQLLAYSNDESDNVIENFEIIEEIKENEISITFPFTFQHKFDKELSITISDTYTVKAKYFPFAEECEEYLQVLEKKQVQLELPMDLSGTTKKVVITLPDGNMEAKIEEQNISNVFIAFLKSMNPYWAEIDTKGKIQYTKPVDVAKLEMAHSHILRKKLTQKSGNLDTTITIKSDEMATEEVLNLFSIPTFFFPDLNQ